jgi:DNA polymerase-3 subunit epsilon
MEFVVYDTETTGLLQPSNSPLESQPEIIEFYGVRMNEEFEILSEVNQLILPVQSIPKDATHVHGITNEMVENKPDFGDVADDIVELIDGANLLVAHNISFDNGMLDVCFKRLNRERPKANHDLCTVEATMAMKGFRLSLTRLHQMLFNTNFKAHRAKDDVFALVRCFHSLTEQGVINLEHYSN